MGITVDVTYKSLNKDSEILCGDTVEYLKTGDSDVIILADGMGSGVKANILSTLTTKILGTMFLNGATLEECLETIVQTLPICQIRQVAYSTFSIMQIFNNGEVYLVEYDNPRCIFLRGGHVVKLSKNKRLIKDKEIRECRFQVQKGDALILMSDGVTHAGVGKSQKYCFGWPWEDVAEFAANQYEITPSAVRMVAALSDECNRIYENHPGDDTTIAVARIIDRKSVHLMTGPPVSRDDDERITEDFMKDETARKVISGGTSATIVSRELGKPLRVSLDYFDPDIPPIAHMESVDLVTEGVLTLRRAIELLRDYVEECDLDQEFFQELDKKNGASMLAKMLIEDCTELHLFVGR
ncbi:MAG: SpoIIE family protein phosphatase, partial [Clostridium sp.]|nr:SpoIIE family protein phosphatase [Clostridium sp.]